MQDFRLRIAVIVALRMTGCPARRKAIPLGAEARHAPGEGE